MLEANAYGVKVPGYEGKACMVSLQVSAAFDWKALEARVSLLPKHARPRFVCLNRHENEKTTTLKLKKLQLAERGLGDRTNDNVWLLDLAIGKYSRLGRREEDAVSRGQWRL